MAENTVRVRIAVAVNGNGAWSAEGWCDGPDAIVADRVREMMTDCERMDSETVVRWVEADVPLPTVASIPGTVVS